MTLLFNGWRTWNMQCLQGKREKTVEAKRLGNALSAEDRVRDVVAALGHTEHVHLRRRVWVPEEGRNREIDVIAVTDHGLLVIEVKNWVGFIWQNGRKWYQKPPSKHAKAIEFFDIMGEHEKKVAALATYLRNCGVDIPDNLIKPVLLFSNKNCKLDAQLEANPNVHTLESFKKSVAPRAAVREWVTHYVPFMLGTNEISAAMKTNISDALRSVRTWDIVHLHNGTLLHGDLVGVELPTDGISLTRADFKTVAMHWSRTDLWGMLSSLWYGSACELDVELHRPLRRRGYTPKKGTPPTMRLKTLLRMPKGKDINGKDRIVFQPAGKPFREEYPLILVASILVCRKRYEGQRVAAVAARTVTNTDIDAADKAFNEAAEAAGAAGAGAAAAHADPNADVDGGDWVMVDDDASAAVRTE